MLFRSRGGVQDRGPDWASYVSDYRPDRDATAHEQQRLIEFAKLISQRDVDRFRAQIGDFLDVDEFLRFLAVNALIANGDSYLNGSHNFYLYLDPKDDRFRFIPWDTDLSLGTRNFGGGVDLLQPFRGDQPLIYWVLNDPANAAKYRAILTDLANNVFTVAKLNEMVDALEKIGAGKLSSPRAFLEQQAKWAQQVVGALNK